MDITYAYAGDILKWDETPEGLEVHGVATSSALDLDRQSCDQTWLKSAMPEWYKWGNVREQHSSIAAGVGRELAEGADGKWGLKSLVVDDGTAKKVKAGVLKGYSIGIRNARLAKDASAPNGRIVGGDIVEISLVDRPCNPEATISLAKAHGADMLPVDQAGDVIVKMDDLVSELNGAPAEAEIETVPGAVPAPAADDSSHGHPGDEDETGKALSLAEYRAAVALVKGVHSGRIVKGTNNETADIAGAQAVIKQIAALIVSEATELGNGRQEELCDIQLLTSAVYAMQCFLGREKDQDGEPNGSADATSYVGLAAEPDLEKRDFSQKERDAAASSGAAMKDGSFPIKNKADLKNAIHLAGNAKDPAAARAHIKRRAAALGASDMIPDSWKDAAPEITKGASIPDVTETVTKAVAAANAASQERIVALEAQLAKVLATPVPGGPVVMSQGASGTRGPDKAAQRDHYLELAARASDVGVADAYRALAAKQA